MFYRKLWGHHLEVYNLNNNFTDKKMKMKIFSLYYVFCYYCLFNPICYLPSSGVWNNRLHSLFFFCCCFIWLLYSKFDPHLKLSNDWMYMWSWARVKLINWTEWQFDWKLFFKIETRSIEAAISWKKNLVIVYRMWVL